MNNKDLSKDVLKIVKNKTGKSVSEKDIHKLASKVGPKTVQNEDHLRQLIMQVSKMVNIPVSESTINDIIKAIQKSGLNPDNMQQMMKMMMGKK